MPAGRVAVATFFPVALSVATCSFITASPTAQVSASAGLGGTGSVAGRPAARPGPRRTRIGRGPGPGPAPKKLPRFTSAGCTSFDTVSVPAAPRGWPSSVVVASVIATAAGFPSAPVACQGSAESAASMSV